MAFTEQLDFDAFVEALDDLELKDAFQVGVREGVGCAPSGGGAVVASWAGGAAGQHLGVAPGQELMRLCAVRPTRHGAPVAHCSLAHPPLHALPACRAQALQDSDAGKKGDDCTWRKNFVRAVNSSAFKQIQRAKGGPAGSDDEAEDGGRDECMSMGSRCVGVGIGVCACVCAWICSCARRGKMFLTGASPLGAHVMRQGGEQGVAGRQH